MAGEWKQSEFYGNTYHLIDGSVRVTVKLGDFGRWYWFMYDGTDPVDKGGNFDNAQAAMDAGEEEFDAYR